MLKDIDNKNNIKSHYVLISDLSKLLCSHINTHHKAYFCERCLQHFYMEETLSDHLTNCNKCTKSNIS